MNSASRSSATAITTHISLHANATPAFAAWQSKFSSAAAQAPGFLTLDILSDSVNQLEWQITLRFRLHEALASWLSSARRGQMFAELKPMLDPAAAQPNDELTSSLEPLSCVTEVITTFVEPGKEQIFQAWAERMQLSQATFPGYMGTLIQAPISDELRYWTTLLRFSSPAQLDAWLSSADRKLLLQEIEPKIATWKSYRMASPFAGWFPSEGDSSPSAWKQTMLVLLVLFPIVMLEFKFLNPLLAGQNLVAATFIGNAISVALVSWPLMRIAVFSLGWWLRPAAKTPWRRDLLGLMLVLALYALEIAVFIPIFEA